MSAYLDLDDITAQSPLAARELATLRSELAEAKARVSELESLKSDFVRLIDKHAGTLKERDRLRAEVEALNARLEVNPDAPDCDGIYCRDTTIRMLEDDLREARAEVEALRSERDALEEPCSRLVAMDFGADGWGALCDAQAKGIRDALSAITARKAAKRAAQAKEGAE